MEKRMTPAQVRMARAALDLSMEQLATDAAIDAKEIVALERGGGSPDVSAKLRATFEGAGIEFLAEDGVKQHPQMKDSGRIAVENLNSANDE